MSSVLQALAATAKIELCGTATASRSQAIIFLRSLEAVRAIALRRHDPCAQSH